MFFLPTGKSAAEARQVCSTCPVTGECLDYAIENHMVDGIWGGMTVKQRRRAARLRVVA
jgi:WhiB family redox-sensing transcriptional regulator